jgi:hypothetical protein
MTDLLSSVIVAHGGLDRWRTVRAIDVTFNFSGGLLDLKGYPGHRRPSASVHAATPRTVFQTRSGSAAVEYNSSDLAVGIAKNEPFSQETATRGSLRCRLRTMVRILSDDHV